MVMVRDWRLGALRYSFIVGTFIYVFVYALYLNRGYMDIQEPHGTATATLERPRNTDWNTEQFEYCNASSLSTNYSDPLLCELWSEDMVLYPTVISDTMSITTRVSEKFVETNKYCTYEYFDQKLCNGTTEYVTFSTPKRYLAGVENYTLGITHSMLDMKHYELTGHEKYCLTGEQMEGKMVDFNGNVIKSFVANEPLIVSLQELLDAAGTDLSYPIDAVNNNGSINQGESMRHSGIVLIVLITYDNTYATHDRNPKYTLRVIRIKRAEYKVIESVYLNSTIRMIRDRHGVYISFEQGGKIGKFNFQTSLITLVTSLGLLGLSTLIVDLLMLYCCKHKTNYFKDKYAFTAKYAKDPKLELLLNATGFDESVVDDDNIERDVELSNKL